jgi:hypothetical protein
MIDAGSTLRGRYISRQEDKYSSEYPDLDEQSANDVKAESRFVKVTKQFRSTCVLAHLLPLSPSLFVQACFTRRDARGVSSRSTES